MLSAELTTQIAAGQGDARLLRMIGLVLVTQTIDLAGEQLPAGEYVIEVQGDAVPDYQTMLESGGNIETTLSGLTNDNQDVDNRIFPMVVAPFVSEQDSQLAEIAGHRILWWCCWNQCS